MGSMTDTYGSISSSLTRSDRKQLGEVLLTTSAALFVISVIIATTNLFTNDIYASRQFAGVLAGIAAPTAFTGVFLMLPSKQIEKQFLVVGNLITVFGIITFISSYPTHWAGYGQDVTFFVVSIYFIGIFTTLIAVFFAASNATIQQSTQIIRERISEATPTLTDSNSNNTTQSKPTPEQEQPVEDSSGGVGVIGTPETNTTTPNRLNDAEVLDKQTQETPTHQIDEYCGNCKHFEYTRNADSLQPYCAFHEEEMDDLDPCNDWENN